ncbi:MAG: hypothetical protein EOP11_17780 [Proteobacteria bacterium]|nr:MAG: hypothetical protein EOP11_17780 [Pseudomonadota bacterium]
MKTSLALIICAFVSSPAMAYEKGQNYAALSYAFATANIGDETEENYPFATSGQAFGGTIGHLSTKSLAWELYGKSVSFKEKVATQDTSSTGGGILTTTARQSAWMIAAGGRYFLGEYFNLHAGIGLSSSKPTISTTSSNGSTTQGGPGGKSSYFGLGLYGGAGVQYPFKRFDIMLDYAFHSYSQVSDTEISLGLRFKLKP